MLYVNALRFKFEIYSARAMLDKKITSRAVLQRLLSCIYL